jgi:plasmid maintenance system antidote protein VapI
VRHGRGDIAADTALRLAHFFGTSAEFWINLQSHYHLRIAQQKTGKTLKSLLTLKRMTAVHA